MSDHGAPVNGRLARIRDRHFDCYVDLAAAAQEEIEGESSANAPWAFPSTSSRASGRPPSVDAEPRSERLSWLEVLDSEIANIRSALDWGLSSGRPGTARFGTSLVWFWQSTRRLTEGRQVIQRALRQPDLAPADRMEALYAAAVLAADQGDRPVALDYYESARDLAASLGATARRASACRGIGWMRHFLLDSHGATTAFDEALDLAEHISLEERADIMRGLGWARGVHEGHEIAIELHRQAGKMLEEAGDPALADHYLIETSVLIQAGRLDEALVMSETLLGLARAGRGPLTYALGAKARIANLLGDSALLRASAEEGIVAARVAGDRRWEARFQERLATNAMRHGEVDVASETVDRALLILQNPDLLTADELELRAEILEIRARLAEDDGDLELAKELYRQAIAIQRGISVAAHADALATLGNLLADHGDLEAARMAFREAIALIVRTDPRLAVYWRIPSAVLDDELEVVLQLTGEALAASRLEQPGDLPGLLRRQAATLIELDRLDEASSAAEAAVGAGPETLDEAGRPSVNPALGRARSQLERARVRICANDIAGARSDVLGTGLVAGSGWAADQLHVATTLARLALFEGRQGAAVALWSAVQGYRTANQRIAPRLSRRFEEPLHQLRLPARHPALDSRAALDALRTLVTDEFTALAGQVDD